MKTQDERYTRENELLDLKKVMDTPEGQRLIARLLTFCRVGKSVWAPGVEIHYNVGVQDVGHYIQDEVAMAQEFKK